MKKIKIVLSLVLLLGLSACSSSNDTSTESGTTDANESETQNGVETSENFKEYNQVVTNDDLFEITLTTVEFIEDDIFWDSIEITFEVLNKTDRTVEVQADEVSIDNRMIDFGIYSMSQEISAGKIADCVLTLTTYDEDEELPAMEDNLEMILNIFDWEDWEFEHNYNVKLDF